MDAITGKIIDVLGKLVAAVIIIFGLIGAFNAVKSGNFDLKAVLSLVLKVIVAIGLVAIISVAQQFQGRVSSAATTAINEILP